MYFTSFLFLMHLVISSNFTSTCKGIKIINNYILIASCLNYNNVFIISVTARTKCKSNLLRRLHYSKILS
jgi:hypothetical protein